MRAIGPVDGRPPLRLALAAMATRFELLLYGDEPVRLRAIGEAALQEIADCDALLSRFRRGSAVDRINRAAGRPVRVDAGTFGLLQRCAGLGRASGGAFDVTVAPLSTGSGGPVGMQLFEFDAAAGSVRLAVPGMGLDLGAVGKGFALDQAAAVLREHGVAAALLHGGTSTVLAVGAPPGQPGFRIGIGPWPEPPVAVLRSAALSVSADHGRGHVFDPRSRLPVGSRVAAAAVLAADATTADALSTALLVEPEANPPPDTAFLCARGDGPGWHGAGDRLPAILFPDRARFPKQPAAEP